MSAWVNIKCERCGEMFDDKGSHPNLRYCRKCEREVREESKRTRQRDYYLRNKFVDACALISEVRQSDSRIDSEAKQRECRDAEGKRRAGHIRLVIRRAPGLHQHARDSEDVQYGSRASAAQARMHENAQKDS